MWVVDRRLWGVRGGGNWVCLVTALGLDEAEFAEGLVESAAGGVLVA